MTRRTRVLIVALTVVAVALPVVALASDRFKDVPNSNVFHDDISWLADGNVTLGCNPPANDRFCPGDVVTRQQMAAFMRRLASNRVVNAGELEGRTAAEVGSRAAYAFSTNLPNENTTLQTPITAPRPGLLVMNGAVDITESAADTRDTVVCRMMVDGTVVPGTTMYSTVGRDAVIQDSNEGICSTTGAIPVAAGDHNVVFDIASVSEASLFQASLNVTWVPFDGNGETPSPASPGPSPAPSSATETKDDG